MRLREALAASKGHGYIRSMSTEAHPAASLEIKLFGGLEIRRDGELVPLPQSKKTRALLAYLILKATPQRRDALCELLWEIPDDPRAALRWSLSKLRPIVNEDAAERLTADRERVAFELHGADADILRVEEACANGLDSVSDADVASLCHACSGELLAGLDLPSQPSYETWRLGQQEKARRLHLQLIDELISRTDAKSPDRTALLRRRLEVAPDDPGSHLNLIAHLAATSPSEAAAQTEASRRMLADIGGLDEAQVKAALQGRAKPETKPVTRTIVEPTTLRQDIRFCTSKGGVRIAYATVGSGPPLVKTANWLNHLEFDWESPIWRHMFRAFAADNTFIRYDSRGNGLSDWSIQDLSLDALVADLKSVVDAAGVERFPLFALSQGCAVAIEFAVRYPERVSKLILYGGYAQGWRKHPERKLDAQADALITLARAGWGRDNPAFRQIFTSLFIPGATQEQMDWFNELQRLTTSPENAATILESHASIDVVDRLPLVTQPTLVLHVRNESCVRYPNGKQIAMGIPNATFVTLEGQNHLLLEQEPAWPRFLAEVRAFLRD